MTEASAARGGRVSIRTGGKVILLGEHAVVYGAPALLSGVALQVQAEVTSRRSAGASQLKLGGATHGSDCGSDSDIARAWAALLHAAAEPAPLNASIEGLLPPGVGLGYSAAAGVALARGVEQLASGRQDLAEVRRRAMAWERVFHGNPSGADVAAALHGGLLRFTRERGVEPLPQPQSMTLCIGLTGTTSATREMVARVAALRERDAARVTRVVDAIGQLVAHGEQALCDGSGPRLGAAFDENQRWLQELGVSSETIETMCDAARSAGALGAKLTGAGGGGAIIALAGAREAATADEDVAHRAGKIEQAWRELGKASYVVAVGGGGPAPDEPREERA